MRIFLYIFIGLAMSMSMWVSVLFSSPSIAFPPVFPLDFPRIFQFLFLLLPSSGTCDMQLGPGMACLPHLHLPAVRGLHFPNYTILLPSNSPTFRIMPIQSNSNWFPQASSSFRICYLVLKHYLVAKDWVFANIAYQYCKINCSKIVVTYIFIFIVMFNLLRII